MGDYCKCWFCLNTGANGECENCGKPPAPDVLQSVPEQTMEVAPPVKNVRVKVQLPIGRIKKRKGRF